MSQQTAMGLREIAAGLIALDARLDQLAALEPNWDGQGAPPISSEILAAVRGWSLTMPGAAFVPAPAAVPLASGVLQLEWHQGSRVLEVEFETPDTIHYLRWDPLSNLEDEGTFPVIDRARAEELIAWVTGSCDA